MTIQVGDTLPTVGLTTMTAEGPKPVSLSELSSGKKIVLFAVPGAFTPTCSAQHLPGFLDKNKDLKEKGVDIVACVSVNDPFVMKGARFDKSFSIFVFNTLTESERIDAFHELLHCSNDALIAVRTDKVNGEEFEDGVITKRGTFQTQLDCDDWLCFFTQWSRFGFKWPDVLHRGSGFAIIRLEREKVSQDEGSE